jgi:ABC-type phosphate transport system substrate-binding protein
MKQINLGTFTAAAISLAAASGCGGSSQVGNISIDGSSTVYLVWKPSPRSFAKSSQTSA